MSASPTLRGGRVARSAYSQASSESATRRRSIRRCAGSARAVFLHGSERKTRLALVTPSGAVTDISFPLPAASFGAYDFDGRRVAFATKHCLYLATLPITAPDTPPSGPCRRRAAADRTARRDAAGSRRSAAPLDALSRSAPQGARP